MNTIRVGAVNYLNTRPLIRHLAELAPSIDLVLEVPRQLARDLADGRLDVALIPSIEYFREGTYTILPGASISSFGPVMSVKVCSRKPFARIESLALDVGSLSSVALASILLKDLFGVSPATVPLPLDRSHRDSGADAVLMIGDRAIRVPEGTYPFTLDLGYEWSRWTGLPFVWAIWTVRADVSIPASVADAFIEAKCRGRLEIDEICREESKLLQIDETRCRYYLEHVIRHDLGNEELAGLRRFHALAAEHGLAPSGVECVFHGHAHLAESH